MQHLKDLRIEFGVKEKIQYSKYILQMLLPFLKCFHAEQLAEKEMEAKILGIIFSISIKFLFISCNVIAGLVWDLLV